jgi:hypothetical protein
MSLMRCKILYEDLCTKCANIEFNQPFNSLIARYIKKEMEKIQLLVTQNQNFTTYKGLKRLKKSMINLFVFIEQEEKKPRLFNDLTSMCNYT